MRLFIVRGWSMAPGLSEGDLILTRSGAPKVGDVVVYRGGDGFRIVHRVVSIAADGYRTRGDARATCDHGMVKSAQIIGRVWCVIPRLGRISLCLRRRANKH